MRKFFYILLSAFLINVGSVYASENSIILNKAETNDVEHTFKYPNFDIKNDVNPHSLTLSIENGYFIASNSSLNEEVENYFNFMGGTNLSNDFISTLNSTEKFKVITFNLLDTIDLTNNTLKQKVISSVKNFIRSIIFYNSENKDAKFTLTFSEIELTLNDPDILLDDIKIVAFKSPGQKKEHYYAKIDAARIQWTDAYNIASSLRFNNLQGYLATITTEEEHNFIYQSLGSIRGWMGAASVQDADKYLYNTKNISWNNAISKLDHSVGPGYGTINNDNNIYSYWHWVAGPEAGQKIFGEGLYSNFADGEPNNYNTGEWCGEYGHGDGGVWNDYPNYCSDIQGYYVEFGGFENDNEDVEPVSLVNTFKWKDYDIRNIEQNIEEKLEEQEFTDQVTEEEIIEVLTEAVEETGLEDVKYEIISKTINGNTLNIKIEVTIGEGNNAVKYTLNLQKEVEIEEQESEPKQEIKPEIKPQENPKTGDNHIIYIVTAIISLLGLISSSFYIKK